MKKKMKYRFKLIILLSTLTFLCDNSGLLAQSTTIKGYVAEQDTFIKILTPLGNQPNNDTPDYHHIVLWDTISEQQVEACNQKYLFDGGVYKHNGTGSFIEKNNFLPEHTVNCIFISGTTIYAGTDNGICISTNIGESWLKANEDSIDNLTGKKINSIKYGCSKLFACTSNGLWKSADNGGSWVRDFDTSSNVTSVEFEGTTNVYAGMTNRGLYLSTDSGENWTDTSIVQSIAVYCIMHINEVLYVGTSDGLKIKPDDSTTFVTKEPYIDVLAISTGEKGIYIGTERNGFHRSTDDGETFFENNAGYLSDVYGYYHPINSIMEIDSVIYMATDTGLYKSFDPIAINWNSCPPYTTKSISENIKMLYNNNDSLWVACYSSVVPYGSAVMIKNGQYILAPKYFRNYNCHEYAWHLTEGGQRCIPFNSPLAMHYIPDDTLVQNCDYIKCDGNDPFMEKVTFSDKKNPIPSYSHSCTKSSTDNDNVTNIDSMYFDSKWNTPGPLVHHKLKDHPWGDTTKYTPTYWKSKKEVSGNITQDKYIGRQVITNGNTVIPAGDTVKFYTGPMIDHGIHMKDGFHAESGSNFHAYIKDTYQDSTSGTKPCKIPWEEVIAILPHQLISQIIDTSTIPEKLGKNNYREPASVSYKSVSKPCKEYDLEFTFSGKGSGTEDDPYQIENIYQFQEMKYDLYGDHYYILMNDIDASETRYWNPVVNKKGDTLWYGGFAPIHGDFIRSIDGRGHKVSDLYSCDRNVTPHNLFKSTNCFTLKRIGFENLKFEYFGRFAMFAVTPNDSNAFTVDECYFTGSLNIDSEGSGTSYNLGLFFTNAVIKNSYTDFTIITDTTISNFGKIVPNEKLTQIKNCYALGNNSPSRVLSPFGYDGNVVSCFWDADKIKVTNDSLGLGLGLSTADMMKRSTFESAGWDFENVWYIEEGMDYPKLKCFRDGVGVEDNEPVKSGIAEMQITGNSDKIKIDYSLPAPGQVRIKIFNSLGALESVIFEGFSQFSDSGNTQFDASALPSGMYFITLESSGIRLCRQYALIK